LEKGGECGAPFHGFRVPQKGYEELSQFFFVKLFQPQDETQKDQQYGEHPPPKGVNKLKKTPVVLPENENHYEPYQITRIQCRDSDQEAYCLLSDSGWQKDYEA
jgi:hypothetical protein